jgi:hypothetical protein
MRRPGSSSAAMKVVRRSLGAESTSAPHFSRPNKLLTCSTVDVLSAVRRGTGPLREGSHLLHTELCIRALQHIIQEAPEALRTSSDQENDLLRSIFTSVSSAERLAVTVAARRDELVLLAQRTFNLDLSSTIELVASESGSRTSGGDSLLACSSDAAAKMIAASVVSSSSRRAPIPEVAEAVMSLCASRPALEKLAFRAILHATLLVRGGASSLESPVALPEACLGNEVDRICEEAVAALLLPPPPTLLLALVLHVASMRFSYEAEDARGKLLCKLVSGAAKFRRMALMLEVYDGLGRSGLLDVLPCNSSSQVLRNHALPKLNGRFGQVTVATTLLIAVGHLSDGCCDWTPNIATEALEMCAQLCDFCSSRSVVTQSSEIDGGDANNKRHEKTAEALRLGIKVLLKAKAVTHAIAVYEQSPALVGPSWELAECYAQRHLWRQAFDIASGFVATVRAKFSSSGLPGQLRSLILSILRGLGASPVETAETLESAMLHCKQWKLMNLPMASVLGEVVDGVASRPDHGLAVTLVEWYVKHPSLGRSCSVLHTTVAQYVAALTHVHLDELALRQTVTARVRDIKLVLPDLHADVIAVNTLVDAGWVGAAVDVLSGATSQDAVVMRRIKMSVLRALLSEVENTTAAPGGVTWSPQEFVASIRAAMSMRDADEATRLPWECSFCKTWNGRSDLQCRVCRALQVALWKCSSCSGYSPLDRGSSDLPSDAPIEHQCQVCDAKLSRDAKLDVISLRPWTCINCSTRNSANNAFFCSCCGVKSRLAKDVAPFSCGACGFHNAHGVLRPWCGKCGELHPAAAAAKPKSLWRCVECNGMNPWLLQTCRCCATSARPPDAWTEGWVKWPCSWCDHVNPPWLTSCAACTTDRSRNEEMLMSPASRSCQGCGEPRLSLPGALEAESDCIHCGLRTILSVSHQRSVDMCCPTADHSACESELFGKIHLVALAVEATYPLWVCLRNGCLQGNTASSSACSKCGNTRRLSGPAEPTLNMVFGYSEQDVNADAMPSFVTIRSRPEHHRCMRCSSPLCPSTNLALVCNVCLVSSLQADNPAAVAGFWLALRCVERVLLATTVCGGESVPCPIYPDAALTIVQSILQRLRSAPEDMLPWRCRDVMTMRCGVSRRNPVFEDGSCHSCIAQATGILDRIVTLAENSTEVGSKPTNDDLLRLRRREWLCAALDLVELVNDSTDFDELGFDSLFRLCLAIRQCVLSQAPPPGLVCEEDAAFRQHMKLEYLSAMKLSRGFISGSMGLCGLCLSELHRTEQCPRRHLEDDSQTDASDRDQVGWEVGSVRRPAREGTQRVSAERVAV